MKKVFESIKESKEEVLKYIEENFPAKLRDFVKAYADAVLFEEFEWKDLAGVRQLKWEGEWTNAEELSEQAQLIGEYNEFSPDTVAEVINIFGRDARYKLAREYSPVIYVKPKKMWDATGVAATKADEVYVQPNGEVRLWWD